ncbi:MAG: HNH endonuclease [Deltaproteobacteria bacterium]|nr:MAG: HNH endonuclease [Deltaproteobacteria bacterium]
MADDTRFYEIEPSLENYWRAVILFGKNVASYKFALAKALYDLRKGPSELVRLDELAPLFADHLIAHLKQCDKQITSRSSAFLDVCRKYSNGEISRDRLIQETARHGFNNVIDAFHNVHGNELDKRFFLDERKTSGGIRLTEDFYRLAEAQSFDDLNVETEARWRLVETAWELRLPRHVVRIAYDDNDQILHTLTSQNRRVNITSSRNALNGYQKGRCFYCYRNISLDMFSDDLADVDHFFPHKLNFCAKGKPIDGVANLVLACKECNRGADGKFDRLPSIDLLARLNRRNEYLIKSHHPLRETLMLQTGITETDRRSYLQSAYTCAESHLIMKWAPKPCGNATF